MTYCLDSKKLKKYLTDLGYASLGQLAVKAGIHRNTLSNLLSGRSIFSSSFESLASALHADPMDLVVPLSDFPSKVKQIDEIRPLIARIVKECSRVAVILLGSRASQKASRYSDWDLGVLAYPEALPGLDYLRLKGLVEEGSENLVRKVDLVNLNQAPLWFLEGLGTSPVFLDGNREAYLYFRGVLDGIQKEKAA